MGVASLYRFMSEHCPGALRWIRIQKLVNEYRKKTNTEPVLVVDGSSWYRVLNKDLDWVCGGQCKEYADLVRASIQQLRDVGIKKLVVFFDGRTQEEKRELWLSRCASKVERAILASKEIGSGRHLDTLQNTDLTITPIILLRVLTAILLEEDCEVIHSFIQECDVAMVEYAEEHNCFAILADDTDFAIFEGSHHLLMKLNLKDMTALFYDRQALASALDISASQLPVLATMLGNDVISVLQLRKTFHRRLAGNVWDFKVLFERISELIRKLPPFTDVKDLSVHLSHVMFGGYYRAADIERSILSYSTGSTVKQPTFKCGDPAWTEALEIASKHDDLRIFRIMQYHLYEQGVHLEDYFNEERTTAFVLRPVRRRIYGFLLKDQCPRLNTFVEEWCLSGRGSPKALRIEPELPPGNAPHIMDLWTSPSKDKRFKKLKMEMLTWIFSPNIDPESIKKLRQKVRGAAAILTYLYKEARILEDWEVRAFALTVVNQQSMCSGDLTELNISKVDIRGVHLATIFTCAITLLSFSNSVCGEPLPKKWVGGHNMFDGKLFQQTYMQLELGDSPEIKGSQTVYDKLCSFILE